MRRPIVELALVFIFVTQIGQAQEFRVWDRTVQVHGFASQGYVLTDQNNWLTMDTSQGSGAMTDMGLNLSSQLTDKLRIGAQVYDRNLGHLGQWHPSLDWGVADYRFTNWLGIRAGKVKTTLGLYNDSQDLDFVHVFALLPQSIYPSDLRDTTIAHSGADVYGNFSLHRHMGDLSYTAYAGHRNDSIYSGYPYLISNWGFYLRSFGGPQYGGDARWQTPVKGLMIGASRMNEKITGKGTSINILDPSTGLIPYEATSRKFWTNQYYAEYLWRKLRIDAEYRRCYINVPYLPGSDLGVDTRGWYVSAAYRVHKHLALGSYYSRYTGTNTVSGPAAALIPTETDTRLPQNHVYDKTLAARIDLTHFVYLKIEGHFMNGYGLGPYPNGFYPQQNPQGFKPNTNALVVKTGFHF